jgi:hypothetical protein
VSRVLAVVVAVPASIAALVAPWTAQAASAPKPPMVSSSFTPNLIGVGETASLSVTIANPNAGSLSGIAFTDTLPAGLAVDDPNGLSGACGSASVVAAAPGSTTIALSGGTLKASSSCTISVAVTAAQPEVVENTTGPVASSAGDGSAASADLTVLAAPTVSVVRPREHARYRFGQIVRVRFTCGQADYALGLIDCSAEDDAGDDIVSGGQLDTRSPGRHQLFVQATSVDGLVTTETVDYTVLPDNHFTLRGVKAGGHHTVSFVLRLPGAGRAVAVLSHGRHTLARRVVRVSRRRTLHVTLSAPVAGPARLTVTYTPKGGVAATVRAPHVRLR